VVAIGTDRIEAAGCLDTGELAVVVDAQPGGDDRHPGIKAAFPGEGLHGAEGTRERLLSNLLRRLAVSDSFEAEPKQPASVMLVQLVERGSVAGLESLDQGAVSYEVDVIVSNAQVPTPVVTGVSFARKGGIREALSGYSPT
jgi:hypothetical protein